MNHFILPFFQRMLVCLRAMTLRMVERTNAHSIKVDSKSNNIIFTLNSIKLLT